MDSRRRSLVKALSWRALAVIITASIAYVFTEDQAFALKIGLADSLIKLLVYYLHERVWTKVPTSEIPPAAVATSSAE